MLERSTGTVAPGSLAGIGDPDPVWDAMTFTKSRDRLLAGQVASRLLATVLTQPKVRALLSTERFSVNGTLLEAWASTKSFRPKDGWGPAAPPDAGRNGEHDFRGGKRSKDNHAQGNWRWERTRIRTVSTRRPRGSQPSGAAVGTGN